MTYVPDYGQVQTWLDDIDTILDALLPDSSMGRTRPPRTSRRRGGTDMGATPMARQTGWSDAMVAVQQGALGANTPFRGGRWPSPRRRLSLC